MPRSIRRTANGEPQRCANCGSEHTCLWRRDKEDPTRTLCNACGIYKTNNGIDRPTNGLFPSWKNGKERVVRRNVSRPLGLRLILASSFFSVANKCLHQCDQPQNWM